ncbi:MAG: inositol monophosphatase family protein [Akkermansiaceae bacterium]|jgi:3'(2'), 5'-bisphosphate nucleotidase/myo-inositol-1(or 4)-monophosphatase
MQLTLEHLTDLESIAIEAALRAGKMIRSKTPGDHEVQHKEGGNSQASRVVTAIDLESQRLILETIEDTLDRYELGLLTEESPDDSSRHQHDHFWCIDPLDGTLAFTKGTPGYSVSISLVSREGQPRIGIIFDPVTSTLYHAVDQKGARKNGDPWKLPPPPVDAPLTLMIDDSFIARANAPAFRRKLAAFTSQCGLHGTEIIAHAGAVLNACGVAEHAPSLYFKLPKSDRGGGSLWDFAATACLFNELGLPASDIHGRPLQLNPAGDTFMNRNGVLFASSPDLATKASAWFK